jgi:hypothetical protein
MRQRLGLFVMILLVLGGSCGVASAEEPWPDTLAAELFEKLEATEQDCPDAVASTLRRDQTALCAVLDLDLKKFKKRLRQALKQLEDFDVRSSGPWSKASKNWSKRFYLADGIPTWVAFDETVGGLMVVRGWLPGSCPGSDEAVASYSDFDKPPALIRSTHVYPKWPAGGPKHPAEVVLKVQIDTDGVPEVLCALHADPEGQGFEELATAAVQQWRYEPAEQSGTPVPATSTVIVTWNIH